MKRVYKQSEARKAEIAVNHTQLKILIRQHFMDIGTPPTYEWLAERMFCSKNTAFDWVEELVKKGELEIVNFRVYPKGLITKIKEVAKHVGFS